MIKGLEADWELLLSVVISFLAGALIGLEREKARYGVLRGEGKVEMPPGVRSFGFISLLGTLTVRLPEYLAARGTDIPGHLIPAVLALMVFIVLFFYSYHRFVVLRETGITTPIALAISYAIGLGVGLGLVFESIAMSVFVTFMLAVKLSIKRIVKVMTYEELLSALEIGIIVFLLGPFLAVDVSDPLLHVINLRTLYAFFVAVLTLSFLGYVMLKALGSRAIRYFSFFGGLVNSEATVVNLARIVRSLGADSSLLILGVMYATMAMLLRNAALAGILGVLSEPQGISDEYQALMALGFSASMLIALALTSVGGEESGEIQQYVGKPISYEAAFKALAAFVLILLMTTYATRLAGPLGLVASGILGGVVSAEAVIFTVFSLLKAGSVDVRHAAAIVLLSTAAAVMNKLLFVQAGGFRGYELLKLLVRLVLVSLPLLVIGCLMLL